MNVAILSRRKFLIGTAATAGGLSLGFHVPFVAQAQESVLPEVNAWVLIRPDDTVVIRIARSEMGQGTLTGLAQLVAEELECDWSKVTTEYPTPGDSLRRNRIWGSFSTGGSRGIRESHEYVRQGGAAARLLLVAAAASLWKVPADECSAANSVITHASSGRAVTYGAVASLSAQMSLPANITLKTPQEWKIAGKPLPRLDTRDKLIGKQIYGVDLTLPGMLNASIKACPVFGGKVASFDAAAISGMAGVRKVVQVDETAVAVVADTWWQAHSALNALPIVWDEGPNTNVTSETIASCCKKAWTQKMQSLAPRLGTRERRLAAMPRWSPRPIRFHTRPMPPWSR
ncbi:CO/xanthine dehydrogenase Mo-binding subunit [Sinorhizobium fredii]